MDAGLALPHRILLVGAGGREHALAWRLSRHGDVAEIVVAPGSDGIAAEPKVRCALDVAATDAPALVELGRREAVDLVVVGPEAPLAAGVADAFEAAGIPVFGPTAAAARIESSKAFCREVAAAAGVRMARGAAFATQAGARAFAAGLASEPGSPGVVIKADGLAAGKGVTVCDSVAEADAALEAIFAEAAPMEAGLAGTAAGRSDTGRSDTGRSDTGRSDTGRSDTGRSDTGRSDTGRSDSEAPARVVVEERLAGEEASLIAICDGRDAIALPPARDHKRLLDGDHGPNTGGMGAYSPVPDVPESLAATLVETIHRPILAELARRGSPFRGALYAGLMLTAEGPVLLECNARFGDPEAQALLPRIASPLAPLLLAAATGRLADEAAALGLHGMLLPASDDAAVAIVLASAGYPGSPRHGDEIRGLDRAAAGGALVFHAGTSRDDRGRYVTHGGRVLSVVGLGATLGAARERAERAAAAITWPGVQRRHDIAERPPAPWVAGAAPADPPRVATGRGGSR